MKDTGDMDALLRQMASSGVPVEGEDRTAERRERVVSHLENFHVELRATRARRRRRLLALGAAAAVLIAMGGLLSVRRGIPRPVAHAADAHGAPTLALASQGATLSRASHERAAVSGAALAPGDRLRTRDGAARLALSSGAEVQVGDATELRYEAPQAAGWMHESLDLDAGRVDVHVPKLPSGGTFDVVTPDAVVEVHGTRFSVEVDRAQGGATTTDVGVTEGRVEVRSRGAITLLGAGDHWTSRRAAALPTPPAAPPPPTAATSITSPAKHAAVAAAGPVPASAPAAPAPASTLAQQNALFQAAMSARNGGDDRRAVALLDELLARYPGSPLEPDARVERFRALKRLGKSGDASREARRYLADHPEGFARDEARDVALDPSH